MIRRVVFIGVLPLVSSNLRRRAAFGMVLAIYSIALFHEAKPFVCGATNALNVCGQYVILFTFGAGLAIDVGILTSGNTFALGMVLLVANITVLAAALGIGLSRAYEQAQWKTTDPLSTQELFLVEAAMEGRVHNAEMLGGDSQEGLEMCSPEGNDNPSQGVNQFSIQAEDVELLKKVGSGSFGEVFHAICLGEEVAVKTLHRINDTSLAAFRGEILLHSSLRHPNLCGFVGGVWSRKLVGLVIEWVAKGPLSDMLTSNESSLSWEESLLRLATDIARGMKYLHGREYYDDVDGSLKRCVMHRDLKSDNVLITERCNAKVADFGASRTKDPGIELTTVGTPMFAAPECMRGQDYDESVDVYGFGCIIIDMAVEEGFVHYLGRRWAEDHDEPMPKMATIAGRRVCSDIWGPQAWRPISNDPEKPTLPGAPPSIHALAVECCSHEPSARPTFESILDALAGPIAREIDASSFPRQLPQAQTGGLVQQNSSRPSQAQRGSSTGMAAAPNPIRQSAREGDEEDHDRRKSEHHIRMSGTYRASNSRISSRLDRHSENVTRDSEVTEF